MFRDKNVMVEVALQLLVCQVDAHLLERVDLENFKAEDIQDTNGARVLVGCGRIYKDFVAELKDPNENLVEDL